MPNGKDGGHSSILLDEAQHPPRRHGDTENITEKAKPLIAPTGADPEEFGAQGVHLNP
jgi:hypothetical protein